MLTKIKTYGAVGGAAVLGFLGLMPSVSAAQLSSSTLGTQIDSLNSNWYDYFGVLITHYWPFVVGVIILLIVWRFAKGTLFGFR